MKFRLWIALMTVLVMAMTLTAPLTLPATMTLPALAEDALGIEDGLVIEDAPIIEDTLIIEDALMDGEAELAVDEAIELLPGDIALKEEIADMPPATDAEAVANGVEASGNIEVQNWDELVKALKSAQNDDTIIFSHDVSQEGIYSASIRGKTITMNLQNQNQIKGNTSAMAIFTIGSGGELVLKGGGKIRNGNIAVSVGKDCRFMMESGRPYIITANVKGVYNCGVFTMKRGYITQNDTGVENYGAFIMGDTSGSSKITGNRQGVVTYFSDTAVTVSGFVDITGNTDADVLLQKGQVVAVGGPLDKSSRIGITLSDTNLPGPGVPVVVTRGLKGNGTAENFKVWGDYNKQINADGELEVSLREPPSSLPAQSDMTLLAKLTASGKKALHLTWTAVDGAQGYDVYFGKCGSGSLKKAASVTDGRSCKLTGLKKGKTYRAYVKAWTKASGTKVYIGESSPKVYAIAGGYNNSRCNPKAVRVEKSKLSLKVGGSARIKAFVSGVKSHRKLLQKVSLVRYYSTNRNVANVTSSGKVTGVGVGSCKVWVVANNGIRKGVEVVVGN